MTAGRAGRRYGLRWVGLAGALVAAVGAVLIGWQLPTALHRSDRAAEVSRLNTSLATVQSQTNDLATQIQQLQARLEEDVAANAELSDSIGSQETQIAELEKKVADLKKEIAAIGG